VDDATLFDRQLATLAAIDVMMAAAAPDSFQLDYEGVSMLIVPATPRRSVMNAVVYERPEALEAAYERIASDFHDAGIEAWTVWVPRADERSAEMLAAAGHVLDGSPVVMCAALEDLELDPALPGAISWTGAAPLQALVSIAGPAFEFDPGELARAFEVSPPGALTYIAEHDGRPAASVMAFDHDGDCGIYWVATAEEARGRGLCKGLMTAALLDARERGCTTTSLQATKAGYPVYAGLGFRDLGPIDMWELRA
jgi:GNAT superfamily N-acetyltransferase